MNEQIKKFTCEFFFNLKCDIEDKGEKIIVKKVPKNFEDLFGEAGPYELSFNADISGHFVGKGSGILSAMTKFLEGAGKTTLLKIDFDVDPIKEISGKISFKNCKAKDFVKKYKKNFFYRFTFITTFRYLNNSEQVVSEIYVHDGNFVDGDLSGYTVLEGGFEKISSEYIRNNYDIARGILRDKLENKISDISKSLELKTHEEISRINFHYDNLLKELGGDLNDIIKRINNLEVSIRFARDDEAKLLNSRLEKLKNSLVKSGSDDSRDRILKERDFTIKDAMHKYSLNIDNKLVNTTVIYYPIFNFNLVLEGNGISKKIEMNYDPLTKILDKVKCDSCGDEITKINLCSGSHIVCDNCIGHCGDCGKIYCQKCLARQCSSCGKSLCISCAQLCIGCSSYSCRDHIRKDCVSGEELCAKCLRACLRCHGMSQEKYFGESLDGSKVCQKCLGEENRLKIMSNVFGE